MGFIKGLFGGGKESPPPPAPYVAPSTIDNSAVQAEAEAERKRQRLARGLSSTDLTGGAGLTDQPNVSARTLLKG